MVLVSHAPPLLLGLGSPGPAACPAPCGLGPENPPPRRAFGCGSPGEGRGSRGGTGATVCALLGEGVEGPGPQSFGGPRASKVHHQVRNGWQWEHRQRNPFSLGVQGHRECLGGGTVMSHGEGPPLGANPSLLPSSSLWLERAQNSPDCLPASTQPRGGGPGPPWLQVSATWLLGGWRGGGQGPEQHQSGRNRRGSLGRPEGGQAEPGQPSALLPTLAVP